MTHALAPVMHMATGAPKPFLRGYLADERLRASAASRSATGLALVFQGWELVGAEAVDGASA